jgi:hypothetical protein
MNAGHKRPPNNGHARGHLSRQNDPRCLLKRPAAVPHTRTHSGHAEQQVVGALELGLGTARYLSRRSRSVAAGALFCVALRWPLSNAIKCGRTSRRRPDRRLGRTLAQFGAGRRRLSSRIVMAIRHCACQPTSCWLASWPAAAAAGRRNKSRNEPPTSWRRLAAGLHSFIRRGATSGRRFWRISRLCS